MAKKEKYLKDFLEKIDSGKNVNLLYKDNALNHQRYYEDYSTILLEHNILEYLNKITPNEIREESYMVKEHNGITKQGDIRKPKFKWEERECIALKNYYTSKKTEDNFKILDYQMPLKNTNKDKEDGVDLIGTDGKDVYLLEYKRFTSKETLLRSALEIYTYRKLLEDAKNRVCLDYNCPEGKLIPAILIMKGSEQYKSWESHDSNSSIKKLIHELGISVFLIVPERSFSEDEEMKIKMAKEMPEFDFDLTIKDITKHD